MRALVLLVLVACDVPRTQLMIGAATDINAPDRIDTIELVGTRAADGGVILRAAWPITGSPLAPENLPGSFGVYSDGDPIELDLTLTARKGTTIVVEQRALLSLVPEQTLFFRMGLTVGCIGRTDCTNGQTCVEGVCRDPNVDALQLPAFTDTIVEELTCRSGTQYIQTATGEPMRVAEDAGQCPPDLCREGTCLKSPPGGIEDPRPDAGGGGDGGTITIDAGDPIQCGDPSGTNCFGVPEPSSCTCDAQCGGGVTNSLRCEGGTCTCAFDGAPTLQFDQPGSTCFEAYAMCQVPN
jgi:hypothetical protein